MTCWDSSKPARGKLPRCAPAVFALALCLLSGAFSTSFAGAPAPDASAPADSAQPRAPQRDDALLNLWAVRTDDLTEIINSTALFMQQAEGLSGTLTGQAQNSRTRFMRLSGLFQASAGHPGEQVTLARQLVLLRGEFAQSVAPLTGISAEFGQRLAQIARMKDSLREVDAQSAGEYVRTLALAERQLSAASRRLDEILTPARELLYKMDAAVSETEKQLTAVWENYYHAPVAVNPQTLSEIPALLALWNNSLEARLSFAYPQSLEEWVSSAVYFSVAVALAALLSLSALRGTAYLLGPRRGARPRILLRSCILGGLGLALLAASINPQGGAYAIFALTGSLLLIAGIADFSWKLRVMLTPALENRPSPMNRLYLPAAIGACTLFADLPGPVPSLVWVVTSVAFSVTILVSAGCRKQNGHGNSPGPLSRQTTIFWGVFYGLPSCLAAAAGYANLAILIFMLCFALTNIFTLGLAAAALLNILACRLFDRQKYPVRNAVAEALSIPAAWFFSLFAVLPWFWAVPGALNLLQRTLVHRYTLGQADFNFYKALLLIPLFFLCRSFIKLGKTSLTHLSENMPQLERGVIPPLRAMFSYLLWAGFVLVTMGLLGVDFTSLAVVAGGLSVGIGFGLQTLFNNLISGLILIFGRSLLVGDYVTVGGVSGTVQAIAIRVTILETAERASVYVPNSAIISTQFTNWTRKGKITRRSLNIGVAYGSDTEKVIALLRETALQQGHVLKNPPPAVYFDNFGASSLDFVLNVFIDDFDCGAGVMSDLRLAVEKAFKENNLDIPFPQLTVHTPEPGSG
ncbi:MAG: mechanosensitive ion channel [Deltaproteobacteria bacterium]|jgi:small-conductance mechanosensitive channel|nr:mechanosensitive ion channel [Deltaproteobacteria bacterium]